MDNFGLLLKEHPVYHCIVTILTRESLAALYRSWAISRLLVSFASDLVSEAVPLETGQNWLRDSQIKIKKSWEPSKSNGNALTH